MKTALILGAKSDIAKAIAYELAKQKVNLILVGRNIESIKPLQSDIQIKHEVNVDAAEFDALNFSSHETFYKNLPAKIDTVFCVFGLLGEQLAAQKNRNEMFQILHANYTGAVSILEIIAADFEVRKAGNIIGISSVAGERGRQSNYFYGSSKAGFTAYLSGLRNRLYKSGVHVMTVKPGFVRTAMTAEMKLPPFITAQPDVVAKKILRALSKKKNEIYVLWMWKYIMQIIKSIPEFQFKKMKL